MVAVVLRVCACVSLQKRHKEKSLKSDNFLASDFIFFSSFRRRPTGVEKTSFARIAPMPRGRGAQPRPVARAPIGKTKATKRSSRRRPRDDSDGGDDDDRPGPADAFYEAEDVVAPEDAGGASARRFDVSFASVFSLFLFFNRSSLAY